MATTIDGNLNITRDGIFTGVTDGSLAVAEATYWGMPQFDRYHTSASTAITTSTAFTLDKVRGYTVNDNNNRLSGFIGDPVNQTTLLNINTALQNITTSTGEIGTFYITVTGDDIHINLKSNLLHSSAVLWPSSVAKEIKKAIKSNLLIKVNSRNTERVSEYSLAEEKARNTLRDMITEKEWRRYVVTGFIMVKGAYGSWYQIFSKHNERIRVYTKNKLTHKICIHTDQSCPPTDHVINMKMIIEIDEASIWKEGNVCSLLGSPSFSIPQGMISLLPSSNNILEIFNTYKNMQTTTQTTFSTFALAC